MKTSTPKIPKAIKLPNKDPGSTPARNTAKTAVYDAHLSKRDSTASTLSSKNK